MLLDKTVSKKPDLKRIRDQNISLIMVVFKVFFLLNLCFRCPPFVLVQCQTITLPSGLYRLLLSLWFPTEPEHCLGFRISKKKEIKHICPVHSQKPNTRVLVKILRWLFPINIPFGHLYFTVFSSYGHTVLKNLLITYMQRCCLSLTVKIAWTRGLMFIFQHYGTNPPSWIGRTSWQRAV